MGACCKRQSQNVQISADITSERHHANQCDGKDEDIDEDQIKREEPGGCSQFLFTPAFHHGHMELSRQHDDGGGTECALYDPCADGCLVVERFQRFW